MATRNPLHTGEEHSNATRAAAQVVEPRSSRTFTPTMAVLAKSAGIYHWTPEGRRLYDFTSGVLVANLGHNSSDWMRRWWNYMGWPEILPPDRFPALPMTAYNAVTPIEIQASERLIAVLRNRPGGGRIEQVFWAASGSEAVQKALWACLARDKSRDIMLASRFGFHGKKGLAGAVTGSETDAERDARVHFFGFPMAECSDVSLRDSPFDPAAYRRELESLVKDHTRRICALITEPYLGAAGSYHPHAAYLQMLQNFCREHDIVFVLDEVQSNFGRTGKLFAFEAYGLEPDLVVLGKGLANGVPVAAVAGSRGIFDSMDYGEASDTWSANPLSCAAVLATLDSFADTSLTANAHAASAVLEAGLIRLKDLPFVGNVRGERNGMVWGVEMRDHAGRTASEWANAAVLSCYRGNDNDGIHLLGALARKVIRIAPPLTISTDESQTAMDLMHRCFRKLL